MSIRAMIWAWGRPLGPAAKLTLMALADIADDQGICWPSVGLLATKCTISERTTQRLLASLERLGLIDIEPRFRPDGSRTSNRFRLKLDGGDNLTPLPAVNDVAPPPASPGGGDNDVTRTTTDPPSGSSVKPPPRFTEASDLAYPARLSAREIEIARQRLQVLPANVAQQVLDELAGRLAKNSVRGSPLSYLRALIKRAAMGEFTPEVGVSVAQAREMATRGTASATRESARRHLGVIMAQLAGSRSDEHEAPAAQEDDHG